MLAYQRLIRHCVKNLNFITRSIIVSKYPDINIPQISVAELLFQYVSLYSDNIAYIDDVKNVSYTYSDVKRCMHGIASALTKKGVQPKTMTGIIATNSPEYNMLVFTLTGMGCPVTICNQNYTKTEMSYQLMDSKPSILFTDTENVEKVSQVASEIPTVKEIYLIGNRESNYSCVQDLMEDSGDMSPLGQVDIDLENDIALMPYSSGTTGLSKGVMLTQKNLVANILQISTAHPIIGQKTMIMNLPLYHIYSTVIINTMVLSSGSRVVVQPKFDSIAFLKAIEKHKVSVLHLVPPQVLFLLNHPDVINYDLTSVEKCFSAAAPLDAIVENRLVEKFRVHQPGFRICQGYGLTETSPITHLVADDKSSVDKRGSAGLIIPNMKSKIVDVSSRKELGPNEKGELLLQGPNVMKGYFGKSTSTLKAFEDGWFLTGDIVHYDDDHFFYVTDRLKELIKVKGFQVAPAEVEGVLLSHPAISDCAVVGIPDEKCGEVPRAFVVKSKEVNDNEIHQFISEHLSPHKQLKGGIVFIDKIPKSPSGKILRRLLK